MKTEKFELSDEAMDNIVGGAANSTYMTELAPYLQSSSMGPCFIAGRQSKAPGGGIIFQAYPATDAAMKQLVTVAEMYGPVTFKINELNQQSFTADQLRAML